MIDLRVMLRPDSSAGVKAAERASGHQRAPSAFATPARSPIWFHFDEPEEVSVGRKLPDYILRAMLEDASSVTAPKKGEGADCKFELTRNIWWWHHPVKPIFDYTRRMMAIVAPNV